MFRTVDHVASTTLQSYEHQQLLHRARKYIYIKGAVNAMIVLLFLLTFPPELRPRIVAIVLADALFLVPYWFLVQRYPTLATGLSVGITSLAISAGDWVGGYQTGASGVLYVLLILGGHLVLIKPLSTYLIAGLITAIYAGTIVLEINGIVPINFPFTWSNLLRVVSLNVISMIGLAFLTGVVTRLYRELLQRNKELFALNAVSAAASQSLNLDEVLQLALDKVLGVMELEGGGLYLLEANTGEMVLKVHRNLAEEFVGRVSRMEVGIEGFADSPLRTGRVLVVDDPSQHPIVGKIVGDEEWRYPLIIVPLKVEDRVLGTMNLLGQAGCSFTSQDIALLNTIGAQIGMAIENARLYEVEQDRYRMAESLREMVEVIGSTLELNEVLQLVLEQLRKVLDYDSSSIMMLEGDRLQVIAVEGFTDLEEVLQLSYTADETDISWEAIQKKQALVIADVTQDLRWTYEPQTANVRAWIGAPLIADDEAIGLLTVDSYQVGKYSQDDAQLVMTFARQAALAIKNAQLFKETKQRFEETIALYQTSLDIPERRRAEEMLRVKSHTIASSITAIAIAEFAGNLTYVNPSFLKMWGYDDENEVLGKPAVEFWQTKEKAWEVIEALRDGDSFTRELVAKRKDGSLFDVQLSASMVTDETGKPICMMASFVDITERKRAEEALRESEERFRVIFESSHDLLTIADKDGRTIWANPAWQKTLGYTPETQGDPIEKIHPDDRTRVLEVWQAMERDESAFTDVEYRYRTASGDYVSLETTVRKLLVAGKPMLYVAAHDITKRKWAEKALQGSEKRFRLLYEEAPLGYQSLDEDGYFIEVNQAWLDTFGYSREEVIGRWFGDFLASGYQDHFKENFARFKAVGESHNVEFEMVRNDGSHIIVSLNGGIGYNEQGNFKQTHCILHDITERKRAGEALRKAHEELERRVEERTAELSKANVLLEQEIVERRQTAKALEQRATQLTVVNQVARQAASILDLDRLLQEVVTAIQQGFNYHNVALSLLDEASDKLEVQAIAGGFAELISPSYRQGMGRGIAGWVAETGQPLLANDVNREPHYILGFLEEPLTKAELCVPLRLADQVIGVLDVQDIQLNAFDETDLLAMETLADQLAIAIENARLYQQTDKRLQTRVRELAALYAVAEMVNHSDLDAVLQLALDSAIGVMGMDTGGILLLDPSTGELFLRAHRVGSPEFIRAVSHAKADEGLMPCMLNSVLIIDDLSEVTRDRRVAIEKEGFQSLISVPLKAQESSLGVMVIAGYSPRTFTSEELELLTAIGNQVGVAVDRANLQAQELRAAILEERQSMAQQMHDDIAQTLGYLGLQVDNVMDSSSLAQNVEVQAELEGIRRAIEEAYERVRRSIMRLGEDVSSHFDLGVALPEIISEFEKQTGCRIESRIDGGQLPRLSPSVAFQATYIIGEALANVRKHSGADLVHLTLQGLEDGMIEVTIQDNGRGFDLDSEQQSGWGGFGLRFMRERAERVGGSLRIESGPGQGTRVVVSLPSD